MDGMVFYQGGCSEQAGAALEEQLSQWHLGYWAGTLCVVGGRRQSWSKVSVQQALTRTAIWASLRKFSSEEVARKTETQDGTGRLVIWCSYALLVYPASALHVHF